MEENAAVADLLAHLLRGLKGEIGGGPTFWGDIHYNSQRLVWGEVVLVSLLLTKVPVGWTLVSTLFSLKHACFLRRRKNWIFVYIVINIKRSLAIHLKLVIIFVPGFTLSKHIFVVDKNDGEGIVTSLFRRTGYNCNRSCSRIAVSNTLDLSHAGL